MCINGQFRAIILNCCLRHTGRFGVRANNPALEKETLVRNLRNKPRIRPEHGKRLGTKKDYDLKICTWNVRTLNRPGAMQELENVLKKTKADITAIQELRRKDKGIEKRGSCAVYFSGHKKHRHFGCGFVVSTKLRERVLRWDPIDERLCSIRIKGRFFNVSLICAHAPTEVAEEEAKDNFYTKLDAAYQKCPGHDVKIILGDFNAKLGKESIFRPAIGAHSLHDVTNDNGLRLIDLATERNMVISSTKFPHRKIHKATWVSPDQRTQNQIDHVLIDGRHMSSILDVRSFRGPNVDSDHYLVAARFRMRLSNIRKQRPTTTRRMNVNALKSEQTAADFSEEISRALESKTPGDTIEEIWSTCAETIKNVAESVLGNTEPSRREQWFDEECRQAIDDKNNARQVAMQRHNTRRYREVYSEKRRTATRLLRKKKRAFANNELRKIEDHCGRNEVRKFYQKVKRLRDGHKSHDCFIKDKNGNLITEAQGITERWAEHFSELLNADNGEPPSEEPRLINNTPRNLDRVPPPTVSEVETAIKRLKNNKAAGSDGIPAELFKSGGRVLLQWLHRLIEAVWTDETMPTDWNLSVISPIHKKGDKQECSNYRGISLLNVAYKILSTILCERMKPYMATNIGSYQCGFRPGKSTTDQMFTLRRILERTLEYQIDTYHLFVDFKAAYDSINREELFTAMSEFGIPHKLISLCRMTVANTRCTIKGSEDDAATFETKNGFRQGDALSCDFFNLCLEKIVRTAGARVNRGTIFNKSTQLLAYADDIDIVGRSHRDVTAAFVKIDEAAGKMGLKVNENKTKYMLSSKKEARHHQLGQNVTIGNYNFEVVKEFIYLGTVVDSSNNMGLEIKRRTMLANNAFFSLSKSMRSNLIARKTKITLYKTLILPILMYGSESWTLTRNEEVILGTFERKLLRRMFGPVCIGGEWRIRYNFELYQLYDDIDVVARIKIQRLRWLGHVARMDEDAPQKRISLGLPPSGTRKAGKQCLRWLDDVEDDIKKLGLQNWRRKALDREEWRNFLKEARIQ